MTGSADGITIRESRPEDLPGILDLQRASLGEGMPRDPAFWTWKHERNPAGPSYVRVAEVGGRIVGLRAFLRWRLVSRLNGLEAVRAVDTATHPDFQGKGLFTRLTKGLLAELPGLGASFVFNTPNQNSLPGYLKMGWKPVGKVGVWVRPGGRFSLRRGEGGTPASEAFAGRNLGDLCDPAAHRRWHTPADATWLRWRYADIPFIDYAARLGDRGGAVYRDRARGRFSERTIAHVLTGGTGSGVREAASILRDLARSGKADYLLAMAAVGSRESAALALAGFVPVPNGGPLLVVRPVRSDAHPDPRYKASWRFQVGDLELF